MKILFISFSDFKGGANIAAKSIYDSVKKTNIKKKYFTVYSKKKQNTEIYQFFGKLYINSLRFLEKIIILIFLKKKFHQSLNIFYTNIVSKINSLNYDVINIHWINRSMISLSDIIKIKNKVIINLHDMWFLRSTEHYSLNNENSKDLISNYCFDMKKTIVKKKNFFFIAHNKWMLKEFKKTYPKFKEKVFLCNYYPINTKLFKPRSKIKLRKKYRFPLNKKIVFFSAQDLNDTRKGYKYFIDIVLKLKKQENIFFISVGKYIKKYEKIKNLKQIESLSHDKVSEIYSLSDIFICTSLIDNLPLTVLEALSSGNLVISLKNGGSEEILKKVGYIYKKTQKNKIIKKLKTISNSEIYNKSKISRNFALSHFNERKIASQYYKILQRICT